MAAEFDDVCLCARRLHAPCHASSSPLLLPLPRTTVSVMASYESIAALHKNIPAFSPYIPVAVLPYLAFILLSVTFGLTFYFSTIPKSTFPVHEVSVASLASILGGFGVVALFCSVGVYV
ncbi:hypothetical protein BDY19DRAFT_941599 [Irpex rosettiformis]|uniref:Uncharacterized protein n=1 Tax=Irpex rosettiformis TaxID=378272 RepID=A0ACB8U6U3_9APHY|nr:hypothetical protein BDY19DRAFT_941599 [Irpex rosettiformis]